MKKNIKQHLIFSIVLFLILSFASIAYALNCNGFMCAIGAAAVMIMAAIFFTLFFIISTSFIMTENKEKQSVSHVGVYVKSALVLMALVTSFALLQQMPSMLQALGTLLLREPPSAEEISNPGEHYILMRDFSEGYSGNRYIVMNLSGTTVKHIDATEAIIRQSPTLDRISPHGSSLLLYKGKAQEQSLFLTNLTGEITKIVKTSCQKTKLPYLWSNDGSKIAFNCVDKEQYQTETVIYDIFDDTYVYISQKLWELGGDNSVRTGPRDPIFSPDKSLKVVQGPSKRPTRTNFNENWSIRTIDDQEIFTTTRISQDPQWSIDGRFLLIVNSEDGIFVFDTQSQQVYRVSDKDSSFVTWYLGEIN